MPDPYRNFKFEVEIDGFVRAGFSKVTGLKQTIEKVEYREGGDNETPRKLPGQSTFDDVVLERGLSIDSDFVDWIEQVFDLDRSEGNQGDENFRKKVVIYLKDKGGNRVKKWVIYRAWPSENADPDLDASGNDVAIETLTLANEGIKRIIL
ncbi:MAG: phage tail protein [Candidatus Hermodarchaeia archaeon]|jgi:phage tail-like protein